MLSRSTAHRRARGRSGSSTAPRPCDSSTAFKTSVRPRTGVVALTVACLLSAGRADAQLESFVQAVRTLAAAEPIDPAATTRVAAQMQAALERWDHTIAALEAQVRRDVAGAPDQRAAQLQVALGVA